MERVPSESAVAYAQIWMITGMRVPATRFGAGMAVLVFEGEDL